VVFSSSLFLFLFLPAVLAAYFAVPRRMHNVVLLLASLLFYAWGEKALVAILALSIVANWGFGLWVVRARGRARREGRGRGVVALAVVFNVGMLVLFKYADWLWSLGGHALAALGIVHGAPGPLGHLLPLSPFWRAALVDDSGGIRLPIGVSFFTFQATSYVVDVYRRDVEPETNVLNFGMYKALFPQLIAGPIVRYRDVHDQIRNRIVGTDGFAVGIRRFVLGLGKKVLIANTVARTAQAIFVIPRAELTPAVAWLGIVCYTLQIYFDFSGYSDMAIGLGRMFGFRFLENFEHPYVARSITEFWRRWHISLSSWFRDYLYIPLGGNRVSPARTYLNLLVVFLLCGLWHGAAANFVVWGMLHGAFLVVERAGLSRTMERWPSPLRRVYVLLVVMVGWVFFRAQDLSQALAYLGSMSGLNAGYAASWHLDLFLDPPLVAAIVAGIVGSAPWMRRFAAREGAGIEIAKLGGLAAVLFLSALELGAGSYNPFIYFRF
jgi:alginate O-acetyltransferase complex protein AlgI